MGVPQTAGEKVLLIRSVSLRGPKPPAPNQNKRLKNFWAPEHLLVYVKSAAAELDRSETDIIIFAIELERDLGAALADDQARLAAAATSLGMDPERDLPRLLAVLVRKGLDLLDREARGDSESKRAHRK